ncbi:metalloendopeptidase [Balamuthia mandrillaris]
MATKSVGSRRGLLHAVFGRPGFAKSSSPRPFSLPSPRYSPPPILFGGRRALHRFAFAEGEAHLSRGSVRLRSSGGRPLLPSLAKASYCSAYFGPNHSQKHAKKSSFWRQVKKAPLWLWLLGGTGLIGVPLVSTAYYMYYRDTVAMTGRTRMMDVSIAEEQRLGLAAFEEAKRAFANKILPPTHPTVKQVKSVGMRIVQAAALSHYDWEFIVIARDDIANAVVFPGGKVCVFTGILPIVQDEDGLASVLAHEIGHVVARHGGERWSKMRVQRLVSFILSFFVRQDMAVGMFEELVVTLPFSRKLEQEADYIGLMLMARACYDPSVSIRLWERMNEAQASPAQFLSTHPSSNTRIKNIRSWLEEAKAEGQRCCHTDPKRARMVRTPKQ